jgi:pyruvate dehydrogenase E2 component (dihydrolipoamide acetyltransferase)
MARQRQVELTSIPGSGPHGRIQRADVEAFAGNGQQMSTMRRTIAARMQSSWQNAPHIFFEVAVDGTRINGLREAAKKRLSVTAILIKACAWTLQKNPKLNATFENDTLILHPNANIGMAVALDDGLIVPTIRRAESLSLSEIQIQVDDLTERAHAGKLRLDDLAAGTFTVSNLGMRGVDRFTAIINPPQVAILAVGRMIRQFVPDEHDQPLVRPMMTLTLSVDHRVVDGADAAAFLEDLSAVLAEPSLLAW